MRVTFAFFDETRAKISFTSMATTYDGKLFTTSRSLSLLHDNNPCYMPGFWPINSGPLESSFLVC